MRTGISETKLTSIQRQNAHQVKIAPSAIGIIINKNIKVRSFVFYADYGSKEISIKHNGNSFNKDACELIAVLKRGAEVYINEISVIDNNGRESITTPMRFTIK